MATNKRDLQAYAKFDGTGKVIPGSLVLRRTKPKNGVWKEMQTYECCNQLQQPVNVIVTDSFPFSYPDIGITVTGVPGYSVFTGPAGTVNNKQELVDYANTHYSKFGKFKLEGTTIKLYPFYDLALYYKKLGGTAIQVALFAD